MIKDKQFSGIKYAAVLEKSRRDQALNIKEFAVLAGISYSVAREWFQLREFPRVQGFVFWQDFVEWRKVQNRGQATSNEVSQSSSARLSDSELPAIQWPRQAAQILLDAGKKLS
jgi:hypothetical protein